MVKKIIFGVLLVGLIAILVVGAINRTMDRTADPAAHGQGRGRSANKSLEYNGQGRGANEPLNLAEEHAVEWLTLQGTVVSVDENALVVQTTTGETVTIENRAWWFALENKFSAKVGDSVKLTGFYEGATFETGQIENVTSGKLVQLRDDAGRPGWSGRGRRGG